MHLGAASTVEAVNTLASQYARLIARDAYCSTAWFDDTLPAWDC